MQRKHGHNALGQPIGFSVEPRALPGYPGIEPMVGTSCRLERLDVDRHADSLHAANCEDTEGKIWTYLSYGPFKTVENYRCWMKSACSGRDPLFYAVVDLATNRAVGVASYLRIDPQNGSIEVGHINFSPRLQQSIPATEAMFLMMKRGFELGYRRYEWKCDALNAGSRKAAERLGFSFEGVFRQATTYKGRNRDTAWYSIIDLEWPALEQAILSWLDPDNFDKRGGQHSRLSDLTSRT